MDATNISPENFEGFFTCKKKPVLVHAIQMNFKEGFTVSTEEGKLEGKQGDYLMIGSHGEKRVIKKKHFEKSYIKLDSNKGKWHDYPATWPAEMGEYVVELKNGDTELSNFYVINRGLSREAYWEPHHKYDVMRWREKIRERDTKE